MDLNRLRTILESIGKICGYANLELLFLNRDIPSARRPEFKVYSNSELQRLNAGSGMQSDFSLDKPARLVYICNITNPAKHLKAESAE